MTGRTQERSPPPSRGGRPGAVIFDVDGTLVDSERDGHRVAFNETFAAAGLPYRWGIPEYGRLLMVTGGHRRIAGYLEARGYPAAEAARLAGRLHADKTARFGDLVRQGRILPRPGVRELIAALRAAGLTLAIATTGSRAWVEPLLDTVFGAGAFAVVVTGSDVTALKPDPAAYLEVLARLGMTAGRAVAVEDSQNGLRPALAAGLSCVAVTNDYTSEQDFTGARAVLSGFGAASLPGLLLPV